MPPDREQKIAIKAASHLGRQFLQSFTKLPGQLFYLVMVGETIYSHNFRGYPIPDSLIVGWAQGTVTEIGAAAAASLTSRISHFFVSNVNGFKPKLKKTLISTAAVVGTLAGGISAEAFVGSKYFAGPFPRDVSAFLNAPFKPAAKPLSTIGTPTPLR